jgi:hypothetical protein
LRAAGLSARLKAAPLDLVAEVLAEAHAHLINDNYFCRSAGIVDVDHHPMRLLDGCPTPRSSPGPTAGLSQSVSTGRTLIASGRLGFNEGPSGAVGPSRVIPSVCAVVLLFHPESIGRVHVGESTLIRFAAKA